MEHIKKAIERAKHERQHLAIPVHLPQIAGGAGRYGPTEAANGTTGPATMDREKVVPIDRPHLKAMRLVAHDATEGRATYYDMLRTQVLQRMEAASQNVVAITSPRPGCGKTVTAINLAMSIARQIEQDVLLVDLDLRKPHVALYLGLEPTAGIGDVIAGKCLPSEAMLVPDLCGHRLTVLATPNSLPNPTEQIVSSGMRTILTGLRKDPRYRLIIFDLPPMLASDDFLAFLPQVDAALLVASAGETTVHDIAECERLIDPDKFLGCVLNKAAETDESYHYYG
jgi:capsular exopolysaccharide synthesis family protein